MNIGRLKTITGLHTHTWIENKAAISYIMNIYIYIYSCKRFFGTHVTRKDENPIGHTRAQSPASGGAMKTRRKEEDIFFYFFFFVGYWSVTCQHSTTHIINKGRKKRHRCCWTLLSFLSLKSLGPSITIAS